MLAQIKDQLNQLESLIQARESWKDLIQHPQWKLFVESVQREKINALVMCANSKKDEIESAQALYSAMSILTAIIDGKQDFTDLENLMDQRENVIEQLSEYYEEEKLNRRPMYSGGTL